MGLRVSEGCSVDDFESTGAAPVPGGGERLYLVRALSAPESPWDDSPSIEESGLPLSWTGILHDIMFLQVSVSSRLVELAPSNGGLIPSGIFEG
jgi:hypothetical protein